MTLWCCTACMHGRSWLHHDISSPMALHLLCSQHLPRPEILHAETVNEQGLNTVPMASCCISKYTACKRNSVIVNKRAISWRLKLLAEHVIRLCRLRTEPRCGRASCPIARHVDEDCGAHTSAQSEQMRCHTGHALPLQCKHVGLCNIMLQGALAGVHHFSCDNATQIVVLVDELVQASLIALFATPCRTLQDDARPRMSECCVLCRHLCTPSCLVHNLKTRHELACTC